MHFRFMAAIFDSPLILTSDSIRTSPVVLPDTKNMGIAAGMLLLLLLQFVLWFNALFLSLCSGIGLSAIA